MTDSSRPDSPRGADRHGDAVSRNVDSRRFGRRGLANVIVAVGMIVGWWYIVWGSPIWAAMHAPDPLATLRVETNSNGHPRARLDDAVWKAACDKAGLPSPPSLDGADPVPVRKMLEAFARWTSTQDPIALGEIGRLYQATEEHRASLECFAALAQMQPNDDQWRYHVGVEAQALGMADLAIAMLEESQKGDPDYPTTYARLGLLYLEKGNLNAADTNYQEYRRRLPNQSLGFVGLGRVALARRDWSEAQKLLRRAVDATPNDYVAYRLLSQALAAQGKHDQARAAVNVAERLPQYRGWLVFDERLQASHALANTQRYLTNQMRLAAGERDFASFINIATELLERRPDDHQTLSHLATVYRALGRFDDAEAAIDRALSLKPNSPVLYCVKAEIAFARRDFPATYRAVEAALTLDSDSARAFEIQGRALFLQERTEEAMNAMQRAINADSSSSSARLVLAEMYRRVGRPTEAARLLNELLRFDPQHTQARQLLQQILDANPGSGQ